MSNLLFPVIIGLGVFVILFLLAPKLLSSKSERRTQNVLRRISEETEVVSNRSAGQNISILRGGEAEGIERLLRSLPFMETMFDRLLKSGVKISFPALLSVQVVIFVVLVLVFSFFNFGILGIVGAGVLSYIIVKKYLEHKVFKRNEIFTDMFPDALDMIVRSVRSGHPLNTALRMIAENMDPPVSTEFKKVVDEMAYGRSLTEALYRLAARIDQADIHFFVVVLVVQQETGGNLAEVLSNLSNIIRKRKQLRLRIRALTSEGRMTSYVLGSLPIILLIVLYFITPGYLDPLFETSTGRFVLGLALSMIGLAFYIVRRMVRIDI